MFAAALNNRHLLKHPFYQAWMAGTLSPATLQDYAEQYYFHVDRFPRFPRYLNALHLHCEDALQATTEAAQALWDFLSEIHEVQCHAEC